MPIFFFLCQELKLLLLLLLARREMEVERDGVTAVTAAGVSSAGRIIVDFLDDSQKSRRTSDEQGHQPDRKAEDGEKGRPHSPTDSQKTVSDDEEIDYSVKPEFYDPDLDEKDELWVHKRRKGQYSDAVLSCPACFTTLSIECQRHERYATQYRAVFVTNCKISTDETSIKRTRKGKRGRESNNGRGKDESSADKRVCCSVCSTEVGVMDEDEVYHFFNALPSEC